MLKVLNFEIQSTNIKIFSYLIKIQISSQLLDGHLIKLKQVKLVLSIDLRITPTQRAIEEFTLIR